MQRGDVEAGDEVKNGRTSEWGRVVSVDVNDVTGHIARVRVRRRTGFNSFHARPRWWDARNVVMVEKARKEASHD